MRRAVALVLTAIMMVATAATIPGEAYGAECPKGYVWVEAPKIGADGKDINGWGMIRSGHCVKQTTGEENVPPAGSGGNGFCAAAGDLDWNLVMQLRTDVARELERLREAGTIGAPLEAEIDLYCDDAHFAKLAAFGDELRFLLITSEARVHRVSAAGGGDGATDSVPGASLGAAVQIRVRRSEAQKCVRCWHLRADVGSHAEHPELCGRCVVNLGLDGETRTYA